MGYFFQNITDLADFLLSQSETSRTDRKASSLTGSGAFDFKSAMEAVSLGFGRNISGIENTARHCATPAVGKEADYKTAEPIALNYRTVKLLLNKSDSKVSLDISADDLALLLNKKATLTSAGRIDRSEGFNDAGLAGFSDLLDSLEGHAEYRITFAPANLLDNSYPVDNWKIPVRLEASGLSSQPEYVNISELVSLVKNYPDPIRMVVSLPVDSDPGSSLKASMQDSNIKSRAAFAFDLRLLFQIENTSDNPVRGLCMSSGQQYLADAIQDSVKGSLLQEPMDLLRYPLISHRLSLIGFDAAAAALSNPAWRQTPKDSARGMTYNSTEFDEPGEPANPRGLDSKIRNTRLSHTPSGSRNIFNGAIPGSDTDILGDYASSHYKGRIGISNVPGSEMTELHDRPIIDLNELRSGILYAARKNLTQVTLKLYPEKLGTVSIRLFWREDMLSANMKASNVEAAKILSAGLTELRSGLESANLRVENLNVILDNGKEAGEFGSGINARSQKPGAELADNSNGGNRSFSGKPVTGNHRKNFSKIAHAVTHRGWIDLKA